MVILRGWLTNNHELFCNLRAAFGEDDVGEIKIPHGEARGAGCGGVSRYTSLHVPLPAPHLSLAYPFPSCSLEILPQTQVFSTASLNEDCDRAQY